MRRFMKRAIAADQGSVPLFSDFEDDGPMWSGTGPREARRAIAFAEPFLSPPIVHVSLSMWDVHHATNMRAEIVAENITERGFDLVFRTWSDTRIARMRADWLAIGALAHEDDWNVD